MDGLSRWARLSRWPDVLVVALAAVLLYARTVAFDFTELDDRDLIVDDHAALVDPHIVADAFARSYMHVVDPAHAYYRPLVTLSYALDARLFGVRAAGYHATNVVLFAVACALVLALLRALDLGRAASLAGALLFAAHPALVPAVAWIPGRNDTLLSIFVLASWIGFARRRPAIHLAFFALALLTKETAVALPVVCILHASLVDRRTRRALAGYAAAWALAIGARLAIRSAGALPSFANLGQLVSSLSELALPFDPKTIAVAEDLTLLPGALAIVLLIAAVRFLPGIRRRVVLLGASAFVLFLAPSLIFAGPLVLGQRLVLPAVGFVIVVAEIVRALAPPPRALAAFASVTIAVLFVVSFAAQDTFRDRRRFAKNAVEESPHSALAHFCLGQSYQKDGDARRAIEQYRAAIALGPAESAHNNIAVLYMEDARWAEAEAELRDELSIDPRSGRAHYNLAVVLRREERIADACSEATRALDLGFTTDAARRERESTCAPR
jgi:tetratricopeptide (TPR) repeat protein